jgi:hypothetical protein
MGEYDIFFSYRRKDNDGHSNVDVARAFCYEFERRGYKVFFDYNECTDGYFSEKILPAVRTCDFFILLLTKDTLERCKNEGDWVRREIEEAIKSGRKIVPVTPDGIVKYWPKDLPETLKPLSANDGIQITSIHRESTFRSDIGLLIEQRMARKKPHKVVEKRFMYIGILVVIAILCILFFVFWGGRDGEDVSSVVDSVDVVKVDSSIQQEEVPTILPNESQNRVEKIKKDTESKKKEKVKEEQKQLTVSDKKNNQEETLPSKTEETVEKNVENVVNEVSHQVEPEVKKVEDSKTVKDNVEEVSKTNRDFAKAKRLYSAHRYKDALEIFERLKREGATESGLDVYIDLCRNKIGG